MRLQTKMSRIGLTCALLVVVVLLSPTVAAPPGGGGGKPPATPADPAIAFVSGGDDVVVMNADGTNKATVLSAALVYDLSWSPDAKQLAITPGNTNNRGVYVLDVAVVNGVPQGSNLRQIVACWCATVAWSPLGSEIAYMRQSGVTKTVEAVPASGGTPQVIYTSVGGDLRHVTWSSDGTRIAFIQAEAADNSERSIKIVERLSGTVTHTLLQGQYYLQGLDWARGGVDALAFHNGAEDPTRIYTVDIGTGVVTPVITARLCGYPSWSPDNTKLVYCVRTSNGNVQYLQTVSLSTGQTQTLTSTKNGWAWAPDWRRF